MDELFALLCTFGMLGVFTLAPAALFFFVLRAIGDVRTLRRRVDTLEGLLEAQAVRLDALQAAPAIEGTVPAIDGTAPVEATSEKDVAESEAPEPVDEIASNAPGAPSAEPPSFEELQEDAALGTADELPAVPSAPAWRPPSPERIAVLLGAGIGGLALLIGVVLGLVAVMEAGILGPAARISGGLVLGTVLWVTGALLRKRMIAVPSALAGAGMGTLYGALFAGHAFYHLIGPLPTFGLLVLVSLVAGLRATAKDDRFMAYLGLFGALLAPVAVSTGSNGAVGLFSYLFLLTVGTLLAASRRRWPDLIVAMLFGTGAMFVGWTATWLAPESVWIALTSAVALSIPYAIAATRVTGDRPIDQMTRLTAGGGTVAFSLLALPWLVPLDSSFTDPRSDLTVVQSTGNIRILGALALALLPAPGWWAARRSQQALGSATVTAIALFASLVWIGGWTTTLDQPDALTVFAPLAPLVVGLLLHVGARRTGVGLALLPIAWCSAVLSGALQGIEPALIAGSLISLTLLVVVGSRVASTSPLLLTGLGALALALLSRAVEAPDLWTTGCLLFVLGVLPIASLQSRWANDRLPSLGWLPGVLTALALALPALGVWEAHFGDAVIGLVPLLMGAHALVAVFVLTRVHRLKLNHPMVAIAAVVVMGGVTFALPIQVQEKWLTVGWALEAAALAWLAQRVRSPLLRWGSVLLAVTVAVRLLANPAALSYGSTAGVPILNWTLYTWGIPTLCLVAAAMGLERSAPEKADGLGHAPTLLRLLAMATGFALVNVQVSHAFQDAGPVELGGATMLQGMVRSLAWGGWGLFLLVLGLAVRSRITRFVGFAFLLLAAAKVFVYDLWTMPGFVRVGSLIGLGVTLLVSAVLFNRLVLREPSGDS